MSVHACPKCSTLMDKGFVVDVSYAAKLQSSWVMGEPNESWLGGLRIPPDELKTLDTVACSNCGFTESYLALPT